MNTPRIFGIIAPLLLAACKAGPAPAAGLVESAEFGIFYGGQIQERRELPFQLDAARQKQGFRVTFRRPLDAARELEWEITRPGRGSDPSAPSDPSGRVTELGNATLELGRERFEQPLTFKPGDPLGMWNVRVVLGEDVLIDRPFWVYDGAARARAQEAARVKDAGK